VAVHLRGVVAMPYASDARKRSFKPGEAEKAKLTKKKAADAGQTVEVEQHAATVAKHDEAETLEAEEREHR
jgi:hypothetical protein